MRIAIIIDNIYLKESGSMTKKIMLFDIEDEWVTAVDKDLISLSDLNYLFLWLLGKGVNRLYCEEITGVDKVFLEKGGLELRAFEEIRDHPILQALLLKEQ